MNTHWFKKSCLTLVTLLFFLVTAQITNAVQVGGGTVVAIKSVEEFNQYLQSGNYLVVYFSSATCGPCKVFHDTYYAMAKEYPDVIFLEVCYGTFAGSEALLTKYAIRSFPTFVFIDKAGNKKSAFSGTSDRTKAKIVGEIVQLKDAGCAPAAAVVQSQQISRGMQQPMAQQSMMQQPAVAQPRNTVQTQPVLQGQVSNQPVRAQTAPMHITATQPMTQSALQQPGVSNVRMQQPAVIQDVQPIITYHTDPGSEVANMGVNNQQRAMPNQKANANAPVRRGGRRFLGRRPRQRINDVEYQ